MAKFRGKVGYVETTYSGDGIYEDTITERVYSGEVIRNMSKNQPGDGRNDDISFGNSIRIVADAFAFKKYIYIRYVEWLGNKIEVSSVEVQRPRLVLNLGGLYNG